MTAKLLAGAVLALLIVAAPAQAAPQLDDNDYMYVQKTLPGVNTLHFGPDTPSRLMLPVVPMSEVRGYAPPTGQCPYASMRCIAGR
jgi:hypothetical protein